MKALIFPASFPERAFDLRSEDREMVLKYMSMVPGSSEILEYQEAKHYWDAYVKFLMYRSIPDVRIPDNIKIFNNIKVIKQMSFFIFLEILDAFKKSTGIQNSSF